MPPIEIRELIISAHTSFGESGHNNLQPNEGNPDQKEFDSKKQDDLVAECVEQVLEILRAKMER